MFRADTLIMFPSLLVSDIRVVLLIEFVHRMQFQVIDQFLCLVGPYRLSIELLHVRQVGVLPVRTWTPDSLPIGYVPGGQIQSRPGCNQRRLKSVSRLQVSGVHQGEDLSLVHFLIQ